MKAIKHDEMEKVGKRSYITKKAPFFWGTMGIGKSETVRAIARNIAKDMNLTFNTDITKINDEKLFTLVDIRVSQLEPSDLRGLPNFEGKTTRWYPPNMLPSNPNSKGIIFLDEINLAPPSIQASAYQLILDRRLGDYTLPDGFVIFSAGNRLEDRANVFELPAPLSNRFIHFELEVPNIEEWSEWAFKNHVDSRIIAFLNFKQSLLFKFDKRMIDKAFPTPRSWAFCSDLIKDIPSDDLEYLNTLICSCVGEGAGIEMTGFIKLQTKLDIDAILKNPSEATIPKQIDLLYALVSSFVEVYKRDKAKLKPIIKSCEFMPPEFAIMLIKSLYSVDGKKFYEQIQKVPEWTKICGKYHELLHIGDKED